MTRWWCWPNGSRPSIWTWCPTLKKKPSTSELLDWLKLLVAEEIPAEALQSRDEKVSVPPLVGALLKNEQDVTLFEKLVFMQRNHR